VSSEHLCVSFFCPHPTLTDAMPAALLPTPRPAPPPGTAPTHACRASFKHHPYAIPQTGRRPVPAHGGARRVLHLVRATPPSAAPPPDLVSTLLTAARGGPGADAAIQAAAAALATYGPGPPPPSPSAWRTLYSNSPGPSGGKVGPFQGDTLQFFHPGGGTYTNRLAFGGALAVLELSGDWEAVRPDRVNVVFNDTRWSLLGGLFKGGSAFPPDKRPRGHWSLLYGDEGVRCFTTNKGSLFVLVRAEEEAGKGT